MKRIPFSQVLKTAAIDIRREYDRLYGMFCVQKFQDMVGAGSSLKDYCATYFVRLPFRGTCVSLDDFDDFYGYSFEKNPSTFDIEYLVSFCEYSYNLAIYNQNTIYGGGIVGIGDPMQFYVQQELFAFFFSPASHWQQILRRRPPLFQIQGRMAERYPAPAGRIVSRH